MNVKNIKILIKVLELTPDDYFNMSYFFSKRNEFGRVEVELPDFIESRYDCGTTACIAGYVNMIVNYKADFSGIKDAGGYEKIASDWLGLNRKQGQQLFYASKGSLWVNYAEELGLEHLIGENYEGIEDWSKISIRKAIKLLNMLIDGEAVFSY